MIRMKLVIEGHPNELLGEIELPNVPRQYELIVYQGGRWRVLDVKYHCNKDIKVYILVEQRNESRSRNTKTKS